MITKYDTKHLQVNANIGGLTKGAVVPIKVDKAGTPLDQYWRNRLKDSKIDNCVEFVKSPPKKAAKLVSKTVSKK